MTFFRVSDVHFFCSALSSATIFLL